MTNERWPGWHNATHDQRTAAVEAALRSGLSRGEVAKQLRTTKNTVSGWINRHIVVTPDMVHRRPPVQGMTPEQMQEIAQRMRELIAGGEGIRGAARQLGISRDRARHVAIVFDIRPTPEQIRAMLRNSALKGLTSPKRKARKAAPKPEAKPVFVPQHAARRARNPNLTPAQQAQVDAVKESTWVRCDYRLMALPRVSDDEAARLVAEFAAKRGITKCPPPIEPQTPHNWGEGWGKR